MPRKRHDAVHRARQPVGERLQRIVQRQAAGRVADPGDLLFAEGRRGADCALVAARQHGQAAQRAGLSVAGARSGVALAVWPRLRSASAGPDGQARPCAKSLTARGSPSEGRSPASNFSLMIYQSA
jgi:hypothetical protein